MSITFILKPKLNTSGCGLKKVPRVHYWSSVFLNHSPLMCGRAVDFANCCLNLRSHFFFLLCEETDFNLTWNDAKLLHFFGGSSRPEQLINDDRKMNIEKDPLTMESGKVDFFRISVQWILHCFVDIMNV